MKYGSACLTFVIRVCLALATVFVCGTRLRAQIEVAEELFVDLDASDGSPETGVWTNYGTLLDFNRIGAPIITAAYEGVLAVEFNPAGAVGDAYQCQDTAPPGLVGLNATRSVEAWVYNPDESVEETIVSWGRRGGPDGTNMSFVYGTHGTWGALGQWGALADASWGPGGVPAIGAWHHLAYTFDGTRQRLYADGVLVNEEVLPTNTINTHVGTAILLAAQYESNGEIGVNPTHVGSLAIARLRVHDGALTERQVGKNFEAEAPDFGVAIQPPAWAGDPPVDEFFLDGDITYTYPIQEPPLSLLGGTVEVISPDVGATIDDNFIVGYGIPSPEPDTFTVTVRATNTGGSDEISWTVNRVALPPPGTISTAGTVLVDLDAADLTGADLAWPNAGTLADFQKIGNPVLEDVAGIRAMTFPQAGPGVDAYRCGEPAPASIVGRNPTRSVEVWVYNPDIPVEETILAWGRRGGPGGTNMSLIYGAHETFGAVGQWGPLADLGWGPGGPPAAAAWHHIAYTYDGTTTRIYADGELKNEEFLGSDVINTHAGTAIQLAAQYEGDGTTLSWGGTLSLARVRVHDGVLRPAQVLHNYESERLDFLQPPAFPDAPAADRAYTGRRYERQLTIVGNPDTVDLKSPAGTLSVTLPEAFLFYDLPDPAPESFEVEIVAKNALGEARVTWKVTVVSPSDLLAGPVHRYSFAADATDSVGGAHGVAHGDVAFIDSQADFGNNFFPPPNSNGAGLYPDPIDPGKLPPGAYIDLPNGMISALGTQATFEAWFTWRGPGEISWQRVFDFGTSNQGENYSSGSDQSRYIFLTPRSIANTTRLAYNDYVPPRVERSIDHDAAPVLEEQHVTVTWNDETTTARLYVNGALVAEDMATHIALAGISDVNNWLGRSQWPDAMFNGSMNEFRIYDRELGEEEIYGNLLAGPDVVNTSTEPEICDNGIDDNDNDLVDCDDPFCDDAVVCQPEICDNGIDDNDDGLVDCADPACCEDEVCVDDPACQTGPLFVRGDSDSNASVELTDGLKTLIALYQGGELPECMDAADADDNGTVELTDAVITFLYLYSGGDAPLPPTPSAADQYPSTDCGVDPTPDIQVPPIPGDDLGCLQMSETCSPLP